MRLQTNPRRQLEIANETLHTAERVWEEAQARGVDLDAAMAQLELARRRYLQALGALEKQSNQEQAEGLWLSA